MDELRLWRMQPGLKDWSFNMIGQQQRGRNDQRRDRRNMPIEEKQYDERVVNIDRVARVVKGGRRFRFRALVVLGDHKGKVGIGISKGADVTTAVSKAVDVAKKNLVTISLYNDTVPHEAEAKVGGALILIKPAAQGTGLIAGGVVRTILEVSGVKNALSKSLGSANKINTAYATITALMSIEPSSKWITSREKKAEKMNSSKEVAVKTKTVTAKEIK